MTTQTHFPLLERVDSPADLRTLPVAQLAVLAAEARRFLIESVSETGGHLAANLGAVELTIALHHVFNTPDDRLVWDVGHQSYLHKILTGRRRRMDSLRQKDGLAGFPKRAESPYDNFGVGHSSTSISAGLGMAIAAARAGSNRRVVAVIGDGAMTAGQAFEALNHAGTLDANLLVVLNDNDMSISPNVGGLSNYLARVLSGRTYATVRAGSKKVLANMPTVWELARRAEEHVKGMVVPGTLFEELGFNYLGPIDGHDLPTLIRTISTARDVEGPNLLHIITEKGKGYEPAEKDPVKYHAVGPFDPSKGVVSKPATGTPPPTYTEVFGRWLCDMAAQDDRLLAITPAMREGSGMVEFHERFPERYFDVGIAEQHAVTLAAGMACEDVHPVVAIYSTFLQRAYDQVIHDVALQNLPVLFAIDRAGLVGPDGPTHAGSFDLSFMRCIPNLVIMAPSDENECRRMLYTGYRHEGPAAVRYPRDFGSGVTVDENMREIPLGKSRTLRRGKRVALLAFGSMVRASTVVADELDATLIDMRFVKPLDRAAILEAAAAHDYLVTVEENAVAGGAGSGVNELLAAEGISVPVVNIGLGDEYIQHGTREECLRLAGLDADGILARIRQACGSEEARSKTAS